MYGKILEIEAKNLFVKYKVDIDQLSCNIPVYKMIEITSDLLNNAVEALINEELKKIKIVVSENDQQIILNIMNESPIIDLDVMASYFIKDRTSKGSGRGLGLYNVKTICNKYNAEIFVSNAYEENANWISFRIEVNK